MNLTKYPRIVPLNDQDKGRDNRSVKFLTIHVIVEVVTEISHDEKILGRSRSGRLRVKPLQFWKNEHVIYERRLSGKFIQDFELL